MTILKTHPHEGQTGQPADHAVEGYDLANGTGSATYVAQARVGSTSVNFAGDAQRWWRDTTSVGTWNRVLFYLPSTPTALIIFGLKRTTLPADLGQLQINTDRTLRVRDPGLNTFTASATVLALNTWYQVVWNITGISTQVAHLYDADGNLLETVNHTAGTGAVGEIRVGQNGASLSPIYIDQHVVADADPGALGARVAGQTGDSLRTSLNRLAGTTGMDEQGAANVWAGTTGLDIRGALNVKAATTGLDERLALNKLAGTTGLGMPAAAWRIVA